MTLSNPERFDFHIRISGCLNRLSLATLMLIPQTGVITIVGFSGAFVSIIVQHEEVVTGGECRMHCIDYGPEV